MVDHVLLNGTTVIDHGPGPWSTMVDHGHSVSDHHRFVKMTDFLFGQISMKIMLASRFICLKIGQPLPSPTAVSTLP